MGFMDKMKDAASQAGEQAKKMGDAAKEGMNPATKSTADDLTRIGKTGIDTRAVLNSMQPVSDKKLGGGTEYDVQVTVKPADGRPEYPLTIRQQLIEQSVAEYEKLIGGEIGIKVDPNDPNKAVLWGM
jgi:hypothetical protein